MMSLSSRARSFVPDPLRQRVKALREPAFRLARSRDAELERLMGVPRDEPGVTNVLGRAFAFLDARAFCELYRSIYIREIYRFEPRRPSPLVLDCGANIGLATRYFKQVMPDARVMAFEPDAVAAGALMRNLDFGGIDDVQVRNQAVWVFDGQVAFARGPIDRGRVAGHIVDEHREEEGVDGVPCVRLRDLLVEPVDLLKLDIEGAEVDVLDDCGDRLDLVERLFVEYHGFAGHPQRLSQMLALLSDAGFRYYAEHEGQPVARPFLVAPRSDGMDLQLNVFCTRVPENSSTV